MSLLWAVEGFGGRKQWWHFAEGDAEMFLPAFIRTTAKPTLRASGLCKDDLVLF